MGYTVEVNHPHFPADYEMNVGGLGLIPNGGSTEVDEEAERLFILQHGVTVEDGFANDGVANTSGSSALDTTEQDDLLAASGLVPEEEEPPVDEAPAPTPPTPITPPSDSTVTDDSGTPGTTGGGI